MCLADGKYCGCFSCQVNLRQGANVDVGRFWHYLMIYMCWVKTHSIIWGVDLGLCHGWGEGGRRVDLCLEKWRRFCPLIGSWNKDGGQTAIAIKANAVGTQHSPKKLGHEIFDGLPAFNGLQSTLSALTRFDYWFMLGCLGISSSSKSNGSGQGKSLKKTRLIAMRCIRSARWVSVVDYRRRL